MRWSPYQQQYLADTSAQKAVVKSRRIGFSECCSFERACRAAGIELLPGRAPRMARPVSQVLVSAGLEQSKELLVKVKQHLEALQHAFKGKLITHNTATIVRLANGKEVRAFSSNPHTLRGFEGDVMLDEFAMVRKQKEVWKAVSAIAKANLGNREGYRIVVVSTPLGDDNMFYDMIQGSMRRSFSVHSVDVHQAVRDGFPITVERDGERVPGTIDDLREEIADPDTFAQEFECSFLSASTRYIPADIYDEACYDPSDLPADFHGINRTVDYGGLDLARVRDRTAFTRLAKYIDTLWHRFTDVNQGMRWDDQERWVDERFQRCARIAVDATGMGSQFSERMEARWPGQVEAVDFTNASKEEMASGLKLGLSRKRVRPRADDVEMKREVLSMRREITESGNTRYLAPRQAGGHGDRAWSLALAVKAAGGAAKHVGVPKVWSPSSDVPEHDRLRPKRGAWR